MPTLRQPGTTLAMLNRRELLKKTAGAALAAVVPLPAIASVPVEYAYDVVLRTPGGIALTACCDGGYLKEVQDWYRRNLASLHGCKLTWERVLKESGKQT